MTKKPNSKEKGAKKGSLLSGIVNKVAGDLFLSQEKTELNESSTALHDGNTPKNIPLEITNDYELLPTPSLQPDYASENSIVNSEKKSLKSSDNVQSYDGKYKYDGKITYSSERPINTSFIEVHVGNLLQYFGAGLIYPSRYSTQNAYGDVQSINSDYLTLSKGISSGFNEQTVLVKVDLTGLNQLDLIEMDGYQLLNSAIPISRIVKIYANDQGIKNRILEDSQLRDGGIIPEGLITVGFPVDLVKVNFSAIEKSPSDLTLKLKRFDKILGLIAGIRNYNVLTLNKTDIYKSLSDHFFYAVQAIDNSFGTQIINGAQHSEFYKWLFENEVPKDRLLLSWLINRIYDEANFTDKDTKTFKQICFSSNAFPKEEKYLERIFGLLQKSLERKSVFKDILELESNQKFPLFLFAYLRIYGTKTNPELPRLDISKTPLPKYGEYSFGVLNMFFGYKLLRNYEDRIDNIGSEFLKLDSRLNKPAIKFELNTPFDYFVIDKIYNYVFNGTNKTFDLGQFDHINLQTVEKIKFDDDYNYQFNSLFGKNYYQLIKSNPIDALMPQLMRLPNNIPLISEIGYCCYRLKLQSNPSHFSSVLQNDIPFKDVITYPKMSFISAIRENKMDFEELKFRLKMAEKHKEI